MSHRQFWPTVLDFLATTWGNEPKVLRSRLRDHHTGLSRGRITHPKSGYLIIHGDDAPVSDWLEQVKERFRLISPTLCYTEHERMMGDDPQAVQLALGISLNLDTTSPSTAPSTPPASPDSNFV
ncbi:hypothetical protein [Singulisphaera sp. GP187]|uniref:hypothetical protein n=1 Tax=Singulisphaera sp. GP187 TaxID=1882752 RepID=UPI0011610272|nr:hypothetical protein [Singulisphaera sp. GP187]